MRIFIFKTIYLSLAIFVFSCSETKKENLDVDSTKTEMVNGLAVSSFKVWGNCGMCKKTIESSLADDAIKEANWDVKSKILEVSYDTSKINLDEIQKRIATVGYDTHEYSGNDSSYAQLHECCKYDRK